jgi:phosphohistidine swiveling domain-containing protein
MPKTWLPDPSHYPEQMTPLSATVWFASMGRGLHEAMRTLAGPFGGFETRTELGWAYEGELEPDWEHEPTVLQEAALTLAERWEQELKPRVEALTREQEAMRPEEPPPAEAAALLDRLLEIVREQWTIHFLVVVPAQVAMELLHDRYVELLGDADPLAPYRLLEGLPNESTTADRELARLAGRALELRVERIAREHAPADALVRLRELQDGRRFLHELDAYLLRYGGRARWHELSLPREAESPQLTLESIRLLLDAPLPASQAEAERERFEAETLARAPELREVLEPVKAAAPLKETHTYFIDYPALLATREVLLGFGRRLAAEGALAGPDDVWMLSVDELREAVLEWRPLHELVAERRDELSRGRRAGPRPYLGEPPAERERHVVLEKFYGPGGEHAGEAVRGLGASPGIAEGRARLVSGPADFARVEPGDVLVATTTTPAWTPLFPSLAALVTATGGILSHAAVVAREYRLPAVVGAPNALEALPDGARIRVDGSTGLVVLLGE